MKLSIIIVNYNSGRYLKKSIESIYNNLKDCENFETLIIDNNSKDKSIELIENMHSNIGILKNKENIGFVKGTNLGIVNTRGEYILLLNPDTKLLDKSILAMVDFMDKNQAIGLCGPLSVSQDGSPRSGPYKFNGISSELKFMLGLHLFSRFFVQREFKNTVECDYITGSCMLIRRAALKDVGYFDENIFMYAEEEDICFRAKQKGWKIFFYPSCKIIHYGQKSSSGLEKEMIITQKMSALYYYSKRYNILLMVLIRILFLLNIFVRIVIIGSKIIFDQKDKPDNIEKINANLKSVILILKMKDSRKFRVPVKI